MTAPKTPAKKGRGRPPQDRSEQARKMDILDEMEQQAATRIKAGKRISLSPKLKLEWNDIEPGYNYQWASDSETYPVNLQSMVDAGYTFVRFKHGSLAGEKVIQNSKGCNLYLMRCPMAYFEADQEEKHKKSIDMHREVMRLQDRQYAGEAKEIGSGKVADLSIDDNPAEKTLQLMEGED